MKLTKETLSEMIREELRKITEGARGGEIKDITDPLSLGGAEKTQLKKGRTIKAIGGVAKAAGKQLEAQKKANLAVKVAVDALGGGAEAVEFLMKNLGKVRTGLQQIKTKPVAGKETIGK